MQHPLLTSILIHCNKPWHDLAPTFLHRGLVQQPVDQLPRTHLDRNLTQYIPPHRTEWYRDRLAWWYCRPCSHLAFCCTVWRRPYSARREPTRLTVPCLMTRVTSSQVPLHSMNIAACCFVCLQQGSRLQCRLQSIAKAYIDLAAVTCCADLDVQGRLYSTVQYLALAAVFP